MLLGSTVAACSPAKDEGPAGTFGKDAGTDGAVEDGSTEEDTGATEGGFVVDAPLPPGVRLGIVRVQ